MAEVKKKRGRPRKSPAEFTEQEQAAIQLATEKIKELENVEVITLPSQEEADPYLKIAEKIQSIVNPPTMSLDNQLYNSIEVEDEDEEDYVIDFTSGQIYTTTEEALILIDKKEDYETDKPQIRQASFQNELTNMLIDQVAGATIRKMLRQYDDIINKTEEAFIGTVTTDIVRNSVIKTIDAERKAIRQCYNGLTVNYDNIPDFAKEKIKYDMRKVIDTLLELSS